MTTANRTLIGNCHYQAYKAAIKNLSQNEDETYANFNPRPKKNIQIKNLFKKSFIITATGDLERNVYIVYNE